MYSNKTTYINSHNFSDHFSIYTSTILEPELGDLPLTVPGP